MQLNIKMLINQEPFGQNLPLYHTFISHFHGCGHNQDAVVSET